MASAQYPADVHLMLVRDNRLLFIHRAASGLWLLPCSGLRPGETAADGACRTALEQLTLHVDRSDVTVAHVRLHSDQAGARLGLFVQTRRFRGVPVVADRRVLDRLTWCRPTRMPHPADPNVVAAVAAWDKRRLQPPGRNAHPLGSDLSHGPGTGNGREQAQ